jgi:rhodanese-related sulfurtransferase
MNLISREELKKKIDRGDNFKLVFVLGEWHYRAKHIPGSMHIDTPEKGIVKLNTDDDIVVYCSNTTCAASMYAYKLLEENDYQNVRRYAGGIQDWEEAGYSLEGEMVTVD